MHHLSGEFELFGTSVNPNYLSGMAVSAPHLSSQHLIPSQNVLKLVQTGKFGVVNELP
jgi:hypothetical protein